MTLTLRSNINVDTALSIDYPNQISRKCIATPNPVHLAVQRKEKMLQARSMKGKKVQYFCNKISLTGCKWSSLNAPGTETPVSHSVWVNSLFLFSAFLSLG